jgi:hypothetical protein
MKFVRENLPYILIPFFLVLAVAAGLYVYATFFADQGTAPFVYTFG